MLLMKNIAVLLRYLTHLWWKDVMACVFDDHRAIFAGFALRTSISRLRTTTWNSKLSYDPKLLYNRRKQPRGESYLEVTHPRRLRESKLCFSSDKWCDDDCIEESDGVVWMNTNNTLRKMKDTGVLTRGNSVTSPDCIEESDGVEWMNTYYTLRKMKDIRVPTRRNPVTGPASQLE